MGWDLDFLTPTKIHSTLLHMKIAETFIVVTNSESINRHQKCMDQHLILNLRNIVYRD